MKRGSERARALALFPGGHIQPDHARIVAELERLESFVPEVAGSPSGDVMPYALAYVERYQGDVLQLEHERDLLYAGLVQAWQRGEYAAVIRLVTGLALLAGRHDLATARHALRLGIDASRYIKDRQHLASFVSRLGGVEFSHGNYQQGRRLWRAAVRLARASDFSPGIWEPLSSFAQIADILGSRAAAQQLIDTFPDGRSASHSDNVVVALFVRGLYARFMNDLDSAYADFSHCLRLLSTQVPAGASSSARLLFSMVVQVELARVQGHYARSQEYTETALSLAHIVSDRYTVATLLIDQALFAYRQGRLAETQAAFLRLRDVAHEMGAAHVHRCSHFLGQQLARTLPDSRSASVVRQSPTAGVAGFAEPHESLSERELEVLRLVAAGLSNRDIASQLVITVGTVKKHLEHIYGKLNVRNRTSAVARGRLLDLVT